MHLQTLEQLRTEFTYLSMAISSSTAMGQYDINRVAEKVLVELFQVIMDWPHLRNLNVHEKENFPAIDLADDVNRIAIQISSTSSLTKVNKTLTTFFQHKLETRYERLIVYILTDRQKSYSQTSVDKVIDGRLVFCVKNDIQDFKSLLKVAATLAPEKLEKAVKILRDYRLGCEQANRPSWLMILESSDNPVEPFTPDWFMFTERKIRLTGRAKEMTELTQFLESQRLFLWWTICGSAGMGKSRLAHELALAQSEDWYCGFFSVNDLKSLDEVFDLKRSALLIVDYAARDAQALNSLLKQCCARKSALKFKLRILLLERESGATEEWWNILTGANSPANAMIMNNQFKASLQLKSLANFIPELTAEWLKTGGPQALPFLPSAESEFWKQVATITEGRPLLIGLVAAAFSRQPTILEVPPLHKLLQPVLQREIRRWKELCSDDSEFDAVKKLIALNTLLRGNPLPQGNHRIIVSNCSGETPKLLLIEDKDTGKLKIPSIEEVSDDEQVMAIVRERYSQVALELKQLVAETTFQVCMKRVVELCAVNGALQPDLIGEFYLDELWRPRVFFEPDAALQELEDSSLKKLLTTAWNISAVRLIGTLEELKNTTTSPDGYVRALTTVTSIAHSQQPGTSKILTELARLLLNSQIRIAKAKPSATQFKLLFNTLRNLKEHFASNREIAFRHLKSLLVFARQNPGTREALEAYEKIVREAPGYLQEIKSITVDRFELSWGDALLESASDALKRRDTDLLQEVFDSAQVLYEHFGASAEVTSMGIKLIHDVAELISEPSLSEEKFIDETFELLADKFANQMANAAIKFSTAKNLDQRAKNLLAWTFLNTCLCYIKLEQCDLLLSLEKEARRARLRMESPIHAAEAQVKLKLMIQKAYLIKGETERAYECQKEVGGLVMNDCPDKISLACLLMIDRLVEVAIVANDQKSLLRLAQTLIEYAPKLSESPSAVHIFSIPFTKFTNHLFPISIATPLHELLQTHHQTLASDGRACSQLCIATKLYINMWMCSDRDQKLRNLTALYEVAQSKPDFRSLADIAILASVIYWKVLGQPTNVRITTYCEIAFDPASATVDVTLLQKEGQILARDTLSILGEYALPSTFKDDISFKE